MTQPVLTASHAPARVYLMGLQPFQWTENFDQWWGGPPGPRGSPWTRCSELYQSHSRPTRASAADQGVRPGVRPTLRSSIQHRMFATVPARHQGMRVCDSF